MPTIEEGVYWCARDLAGLAVLGNHHFILLVTNEEYFQSLPVASKSENGIHFCTLGAFLEDDDRLVFRANNEHDVKATREYIDPDEHTHLWRPDLDLKPHRIKPPRVRIANLSSMYADWPIITGAIPATIRRSTHCWMKTAPRGSIRYSPSPGLAGVIERNMANFSALISVKKT